MTGRQYYRDGPRGSHRPPNGPGVNENGGRSYDHHHARPTSHDAYRRDSPPYLRYAPPAHDRNRSSHSGDEFHIKGASIGSAGDRRNEDTMRSDAYSRGRSPSPRGGHRRHYIDRDREDYRSRSYSRSRDRGEYRSHSPNLRRDRSPYYGGPPSREVILEGLMEDMVEEDITKDLQHHYGISKLEDVRIIRDRQTKLSRGFGFIRFRTVDEAKDFVEPNYPIIHLYGDKSESDDQAVRVRIAFSREREDRGRSDKAESEWICKICTYANFPGRVRCHRCQAPQIDMNSMSGQGLAPPKPQYMNSGDSDASPNGAPSQFLLIRSLEPSVTEDLLAKGVAKLIKPSRDQATPAKTTSKKGNTKVASTTGDANLGAKEGSLRRVLLIRDRRSNDSWRYGFAEFATIEDAQAALTRYNSFEKFTISSKPVTADFIHAGVFIPALDPSGRLDQFSFTPLGNSSTKLLYWDEEAWASELVVTMGAPETAPLEVPARRAADEAAAAAEGEGLVKTSKELDAKPKKRKAEINDAPKQKKAVPAHLQFWSDRHAELHGAQPATHVDPDKDPKIPSEDSSTSDHKSLPVQSFTSHEKKCCYLCSRQFKEDIEVNKHERLSELHKNNLLKDDLVSKAKAKMAKAGIKTTDKHGSHLENEDAGEYRDRAKERRAAFGATKISLPMKKQSRDAEDDKDDVVSAKPSKGASLLGKMGWSAGEGLGAQGTGRTETIATDMYVQGVGLGAKGGKIGDAAEEAERNTKGGYGGFLERTKDKAKERFDSMG